MGESAGGNPYGIEGQSGSGGGPDVYSSHDANGTQSAVTGEAQATYDQAKRSAAESYTQARETIKQASRQARRAATEWGQQTCSATEAYVREKPWNALGIAAGIGLLVGLILRR